MNRLEHSRNLSNPSHREGALMMKADDASHIVARLAINQRATVELPEGIFPTRVEDMDAHTITLAMPMSHGHMVLPPLHEPVVLHFILPGTGLLQMEAKVLENRATGLAMFVIDRRSPSRLIQRRQYFRLDIELPITLRMEGGDKIVGQTINISGGGMRVLASIELSGEVAFVLALDPRESPISGRFCILEAVLSQKSRKKVYEHRAQITQINRNDQDRLIHFIFRKQREWLHQRKLSDR